MKAWLPFAKIIMIIIVPAKTLRRKHGGQLAKDKKSTDPGTHNNS